MKYKKVLKGITNAAHTCIVAVMAFMLYAAFYVQTVWLQVAWAFTFAVIIGYSYIVRDKIVDWIQEKVYFEE